MHIEQNTKKEKYMALQTAIYTLLIGTVTIVPTAIEHNEQ
jgi:hypothetical protein